MASTRTTGPLETVFRLEKLPMILHFDEFSETTQYLIKKAYAKLEAEEYDSEEEESDKGKKLYDYVDDEDDEGREGVDEVNDDEVNDDEVDDDEVDDNDLITASLLHTLGSPEVTEWDKLLLKDSLHSRLKQNYAAEPPEVDFNIFAYKIPKNDEEVCIQLVAKVDKKVLHDLRSRIYNDYCEFKDRQTDLNHSAEGLCLEYLDHYRSLRKSVGGKAPRWEKTSQSCSEPKALLSTSPTEVRPSTRQSRLSEAIELSAAGRPHGRIQLDDFTISNDADQENSRCQSVTLMVCEKDLDNMCYTISEEDAQSEVRLPTEQSRNVAAGERLRQTYVSSQAPKQEALLLPQEHHNWPSNIKPAEDTICRKRKRASSSVEVY